MYYDPTWDHGEMRYKCALPKILNFVTQLTFNEFESIRILHHGPKRITQKRCKSKQIPDNQRLSGIFVLSIFLISAELFGLMIITGTVPLDKW